jgi:hypothetical protein
MQCLSDKQPTHIGCVSLTWLGGSSRVPSCISQSVNGVHCVAHQSLAEADWSSLASLCPHWLTESMARARLGACDLMACTGLLLYQAQQLLFAEASQVHKHDYCWAARVKLVAVRLACWWCSLTACLSASGCLSQQLDSAHKPY